MPLSFVFRQSLRRRSAFTRRLDVVFFCFWTLFLLATAGAPITGRSFIALRFLPISMLLSLLLYDPPRKRILVTSIDDRAMLKYGAEYDALTSEQQADILAHYRVGTYYFPYTGGEAEQEAIALATLRAHRILRRAALPFLLGYWAGWDLLPPGYLRGCWTNAPIVLGVVLAVVLGLPRLIHLWTWQDQAAASTQKTSTVVAS